MLALVDLVIIDINSTLYIHVCFTCIPALFEEFFEVYFSLSSTIVGISISRHIAITPTVTDGTVMAITVSVLLVVVCEGCVDILGVLAVMDNEDL